MSLLGFYRSKAAKKTRMKQLLEGPGFKPPLDSNFFTRFQNTHLSIRGICSSRGCIVRMFFRRNCADKGIFRKDRTLLRQSPRHCSCTIYSRGSRSIWGCKCHNVHHRNPLCRGTFLFLSRKCLLLCPLCRNRNLQGKGEMFLVCLRDI